MAIPTYTARITNQDGKIIAWVDRDGSLCIEQPNHPDLLSSGQNWENEEVALNWANEHATMLTQVAIDLDAELIAKAEKEAQEAAARQAILDNASKIDEIHAMLTALTNK